jgi:hypothetical protein
LVELVCVEYRQMCKAVQRAGEDPPDEVLHALRIHGKRLRYTGELAATAGRKPARRLVASTVALQDLLGEHQDACVASTGSGSSWTAMSSISTWSSPRGAWWSARRRAGW